MWEKILEYFIALGITFSVGGWFLGIYFMSEARDIYICRRRWWGNVHRAPNFGFKRWR